MTAGLIRQPAVTETTTSASFKEVKAGHNINVAGGNINVNYIVTVGRVLEWAGVGDLLPPPVESSSFKNELEAIEATLSTPYGLTMTEAVSRAGELLNDIFRIYKPDHSNEAFPFRMVLSQIASPLLHKLEKLKYWDIYIEGIPPQSWSFLTSDDAGEAEVIWLRHLETLWAKHFGANAKLYGLAKIIVPIKDRTKPVWNADLTFSSSSGEAHAEYWIFVVKKGDVICEAYNPIADYKKPSPASDFGRMSPEGFRIFMIGLVIEMIHLVSKASQDMALWKHLSDLFPASN